MSPQAPARPTSPRQGPRAGSPANPNPPGRCGGCGHAGHRGRCRARGPSRCQPLIGESGEQAGFACGTRPPCPCPWRTCTCGAAVAVAVLDPAQAAAFAAANGITLPDGQVIKVPVLRGSAGNPAGELEVWAAADGRLICRELDSGAAPAAGRWRGVEHTGPCQRL